MSELVSDAAHKIPLCFFLQDPPVPNLYSPHSYLGLTALLLGLTQVGCTRQPRQHTPKRSISVGNLLG
jgi:hypothetical protein